MVQNEFPKILSAHELCVRCSTIAQQNRKSKTNYDVVLFCRTCGKFHIKCRRRVSEFFFYVVVYIVAAPCFRVRNWYRALPFIHADDFTVPLPAKCTCLLSTSLPFAVVQVWALNLLMEPVVHDISRHESTHEVGSTLKTSAFCLHDELLRIATCHVRSAPQKIKCSGLHKG